MAKAQKVKVANPSKHSRAARRAAPGPTKDVADAVDSLDTILHAKQLTRESGVHKKSKAKPLSRAQRLRREKGMERAEAVIDQLEIKRGQSLGRARNIKERAGEWRDVNGKARREKGVRGFAVLAGEKAEVVGGGGNATEAADDGWEDEENAVEGMEQEAIEAVTALNVSTDATTASIPSAAVAEEDEEEL